MRLIYIHWKVVFHFFFNTLVVKVFGVVIYFFTGSAFLAVFSYHFKNFFSNSKGTSYYKGLRLLLYCACQQKNFCSKRKIMEEKMSFSDTVRCFDLNFIEETFYKKNPFFISYQQFIGFIIYSEKTDLDSETSIFFYMTS